MFLLVPAYPGCPGSKAVKRSLLLLLLYIIDDVGLFVKSSVLKNFSILQYAQFLTGSIYGMPAKRLTHLNAYTSLRLGILSYH